MEIVGSWVLTWDLVFFFFFPSVAAPLSGNVRTIKSLFHDFNSELKAYVDLLCFLGFLLCISLFFSFFFFWYKREGRWVTLIPFRENYLCGSWSLYGCINLILGFLKKYLKDVGDKLSIQNSQLHVNLHRIKLQNDMWQLMTQQSTCKIIKKNKERKAGRWQL